MNKSKRNTLPDLVVRYLWVEFLNPGDGICFNYAVKNGAPGIQWENLASSISQNSKFTMDELGYPVNTDDLLDSEVIWEKETDHFQVIRGAYNKAAKKDGYRGEVAYPNFMSNSGSETILHKPYLEIGEDFGEPLIGAPEFYIISGHGGTGEVWGRTKKPDGKNKRNLGYCTLKLINFQELRILIVAACTQAAYARGEDWKLVMDQTGCLAVLGFDGKYFGDNPGADAFLAFGQKLNAGSPIYEAWTSSFKGHYWGAFFKDGVEKLNVSQLMRVDKKKYANAKLYHYSYISSKREYASPAIFGYFVKPFANGIDEYFASQAQESFPNIIAGNDNNKFSSLSATEWYFYIRKADKSNFSKGDVLNFRFYLMRPDHPDAFTFDTFASAKEGGSWDSYKNSANAQIYGSRMDIMRVSVFESCNYIAIPITLKSDAFASIKLMLDECTRATVSFSLITGNVPLEKIDKKEAWSEPSVIDLRMLSFLFVS